MRTNSVHGKNIEAMMIEGHTQKHKKWNKWNQLIHHNNVLFKTYNIYPIRKENHMYLGMYPFDHKTY